MAPSLKRLFGKSPPTHSDKSIKDHSNITTAASTEHDSPATAYYASDPNKPFVLYGYHSSSRTATLRIAISLKDLNADVGWKYLGSGPSNKETFKCAVKSRTLPELLHRRNGQTIVLTRGLVAALEYLDEVYPDIRPLLPPISQPVQRAQVRSLVSVITCDMQPLTTGSVASMARELGSDLEAWTKTGLERGLEACEKAASTSAGKYSVGDQLTMADICLVPCVWDAIVHDVNAMRFPIVQRIYQNLM